jgi:flagellar hook-associated protein 1 FlgK
MSVSSVLNIAKTALNVAQASVQTTSNNIANVNTDGYSRQVTVQEAAVSNGLLGNGVTLSGVTSYYDQFLEKSIAEKNSQLEGQEIYAQYLSRIESILNEDNSQLSTTISAFFNAWQDLSADPTSSAAKLTVASEGQSLSTVINNMYSDLMDLRDELNSTVESQIEEVNTITTSLASLNDLILQAGPGPSEFADYVDQRNQLLEELSGLMDVNYLIDEYGRATVMTSAGKTLVEGTSAYELVGIQNEETGSTDIGWKDLSGNITDITSNITSGSLAALIDVRDTKIGGYIDSLDSLAKSIIENVNYFHNQGNDDSGLDFFESVSANYAKNIRLSDDIVDSSGSVVTANVMVTSSVNNSTDNDVALRIAAIAEETLLGGSTVSSGSFSSTGTALGISGSLLINGISVSIESTDTLNDSVAAINAVTDQTGVTASIVTASGGYRLVLSASSSEDISVADGALEVSSESVATAFGFVGSTYTGYVAGVVSTIGEETKTANNMVEYYEAAMTALEQQRADISGVSIDEEMANLIKFQNAYQAAARLYTVANEMLQTLMEAV